MNDRQLLTSTELAARHGLDRDRMEFLLHDLGLRREGDDGSTLYDAAEVERQLAARDEQTMQAAAELLDYVPDLATATEILRRAFFELRLSWLQSRAFGDVIDSFRRQIASRLPQLHSVQRARAGAGEITELEALRYFEHTIITALRERRGQRLSKKPSDAVMPQPIQVVAAAPSEIEPVLPAPAQRKRGRRQ